MFFSGNVLLRIFALGGFVKAYKNMTYFIIKLRFVGISQANRALTKPSRAKIRSKTFPLKNMLGLCYTLYIYILHRAGRTNYAVTNDDVENV